MFVKSIEVDSLAGDIVINDPTWFTVEDEIRSLNGCNKDSLVLAASDTSYMGISGGRNNEYVVAGYLQGHGSFVAINGTESVAPKQIVVCGDFNEYATINVMDIESAVVIAKAFYEQGELSSQFKWESKRRLPSK